jgi:type VI secretion system secreted protein Hcp
MAYGGGGGTGKVSLQDVHFAKNVDVATAPLFAHCCNGKHIPSALVTFRKAGEKPLEYLKIKLTDILVSSITWGGAAGGDGVHEQVSLAFTKVEIEYYEQKPDGSGEKKGNASWDLKANAK